MYYIINRETDKLELHFSKEEYQGLGDSEKSRIKSNFLFSKRGGCWVSRAKRPNLGNAERVAKELGAEYQGKTGEELTFEEKMERQADRAAARADRMEARSDAAEQRGMALHKICTAILRFSRSRISAHPQAVRSPGSASACLQPSTADSRNSKSPSITHSARRLPAEQRTVKTPRTRLSVTAA